MQRNTQEMTAMRVRHDCCHTFDCLNVACSRNLMSIAHAVFNRKVEGKVQCFLNAGIKSSIILG